MLNFEEKFEGLTQDIGNPNYPDDKKGDYSLYLLNILENRYEEKIDNLVDDINQIYSDIVKEINLPKDQFKYNVMYKGKIGEIVDYEITYDLDYYNVKLENGNGFMLSKEYKISPKIGDNIVLYLKNDFVVGVDINQTTIFRKTKKDLEKEDLLRIQSSIKKKLNKYNDKVLKDMKIGYNNLPKKLKHIFSGIFEWEELYDLPINERINRLEAMFILLEAIKIIRVVKDKDKITELSGLSDKEIIKRIPLSLLSTDEQFIHFSSFSTAKAYYNKIKLELE